MNIENLIYTHLYQFSTGENKIRQKELNILKNVMNNGNLIYIHHNKM
jgi:hypothetical protein